MYDYRDTVKRIQEILNRRGIDYYLIPLSDYHNSEYFDDYYNVIKFVSGFTGSNATIVLTKDNAYLWTDGRYFIQAEEELKGTGITLMKQGLPSTPTVEEFLVDSMTEGEVLAFDGRLINVAGYEKITGALDDNHSIYDADIISDMWESRGVFTHEQPWILSDKYAGETI